MKLFLCLSVLAVLALAEAQQYGSQQQYRRPQQQYTQPKPQQYAQPKPQQYVQPQQYNQQSLKPVVPITAYSNEVSPDGSYSYSYQTGDGSSAQESGYQKNAGAAEPVQVVQGSYSYTAPDGTPITVTYIADENGYRAEGVHLPTPPPIPEAIQRSLDLIAATQRQQPQQQYQQQQYKPQQQYRPKY